MNKLLLFALIWLTASTIFAQINPKADLNIQIPESISGSDNVRYGAAIHPNESQVVEEMVIKDYVLKYENNGVVNDFYYLETDPIVDLIVTEPTNLHRAVINIAYWGIDPSFAQETFLFKPYLFTKNPSIVAFFSDMINSGFEDISDVVLEDLKLAVVQFKTKDNVSEDKLLYSSMYDRIKLQSRYLFIIWDTSKKEKLPDLLRNANMKVYPMQRKQVLDYLYQNPLVFSQEQKEISAPQQEEFAHVSFTGNYGDGLVLNYEVYSLSNNRTANDKVSPSEGISIYEKLPSVKLLPSEYIRVVINKPSGYNITTKEEDLDFEWRRTTKELKIRRGGEFDLRLNKVPDFSFYYLDVSTLSNENRRKIINDIYDSIKNHVERGNTFYLYISNGKTPITTYDPAEYYQKLGKAGQLRADPPDPNEDMDWILKNVDWKKILETNRNFKFLYFLPENTYKLDREVLIENLLGSIDRRKRWVVDINIDGKKNKNMGKSPNKYNYIMYQR